MPENKKKTASRLKIFSFFLYGSYANGLVVVVAASLKTAQKIAFASLESEWQKLTYGISAPEHLVDYEVKPVKSGFVSSRFYAE